MFDELSRKLKASFDRINYLGRIDNENIDIPLKEIKVAFLEADVNFRVVKTIIKKIKEKVMVDIVNNPLLSSEQLLRITYKELTDVLGKSDTKIQYTPNGLATIMLVGLQGCGKTTTAAKIAYRLKKDGKKCLLVSADIYRPAAIEQLKILAGQIDVDFMETTSSMSPIDIAKDAYKMAYEKQFQCLILDTAGRLQINEELMEELENIKKSVNFENTFLVVDSMMGQESVNVAQSFHDKLNITASILTKMDSDTRGGSALSIRPITEKPIIFIGDGEKMEDLQLFSPQEIASHILGLADILNFVETTAKGDLGDEDKLLEHFFKKGSFTLVDMEKQVTGVLNMGSLRAMFNLIPNMPKLDKAASDKPLRKTVAILQSMTLKEKKNYKILNASRRRRVARGSGTTINDVNLLLRQFFFMRENMNVSKMKQFHQQVFQKIPKFIHKKNTV